MPILRYGCLLGLVLLAGAPTGLGQVTVDLHALQALPEQRPPAGERRQAPVRREVTVAPRSSAPKAAAETASRPVTVVPSAPQPALPESIPQTASIEPVAPPPPPAAAPPSPPVSANAGTVAAPTTEGLRLTFASGQSDLTPDSIASIKKLTAEAGASDATTYTVSAYAPGMPDDPSSARRLSLSRAMSVRSALVSNGVPSPHIFVRALGAQHGDGPADRVDLDVQGASTQAAGK